MTEKQLRAKVISYAEAWQGLRDGDESHMVIIDVYNSIVPLPRSYRMKYSDPWCAAFVSAVAQVCELTDIIYPECGCKQMVQLYIDHDRWMEDDSYVPQPGDIMFYDWDDDGQGDNKGTPDHVGIVTSVEQGIIHLIEGNYSDSVARTSYAVDSRYIRGFGLPDYSSAAEDKPEPEPPDPYSGTVAVELPILKIGDLGGYVAAAQTLLIARGYDCGNRGWTGTEKADGDYGRKTEKAVGFFQSGANLDITGVIDKNTWAALLNLI